MWSISCKSLINIKNNFCHSTINIPTNRLSKEREHLILSPSPSFISHQPNMITASDFYTVMCAMLPLYFAMLLAFASVRWWRIFSPDQCSGINRFVATFAVPVLSFHFISQNNPYEMDTKFILADTVSKLVVLLLLALWLMFFGCSTVTAANDHHHHHHHHGADVFGWAITLFSVATLPNTLVMGIPLLQAMYGNFTQSLMVQLVVLQCIVWFALFI